MKRIAIIFLIIMSAVSCAPVPPSANPPPDLPASPTSPPTITQVPITISLDYVGIRNTHWINQVGGSAKAQIQLIVTLSDSTGTLKTWPPDPESQTFSMDFFQVVPLKTYMGGTSVLYTGPISGTLSLRVLANNANKGAITKAQIDIIKTFGGGDLSALKALIPDKELIDTYWQTWSPTNNWGGGTEFTNDVPQGGKDLIVWGRIGTASQFPSEPTTPTLKPKVKIQEDVSLPSGVRVRQSSEQYVYNTWDFKFTIVNDETFGLPVFWRLDSTYSPQTTAGVIKYPTNNIQYVPGNSSYAVTNKYWFTVPGNYMWKYVLEYPKDNPVTSWDGTLPVSP